MTGGRSRRAALFGVAVLAASLLTGIAVAATGLGTAPSGLPPDAAGVPAAAPAYVPRDDFPDEATTGVPDDVVLKPWTGPRSITEDGAVIDGYAVDGGLEILADDVTIANSYIRGRVAAGYGSEQTGLEVVDTTLDGQGLAPTESAIGDSNYTCTRCDIFGFGNGPRMNSDVVVEDSWIHDLCCYSPGDHRSGIGSNGGSGYVVRNNVIDCGIGGCSGALVMYGDNAPVTDVLVEQNLFLTEGGYCVYAGSVEGKAFPQATGIRFVDNHFGQTYHRTCGGYGPVSGWSPGTGNRWSDNLFHETGEPVGQDS